MQSREVCCSAYFAVCCTDSKELTNALNIDDFNFTEVHVKYGYLFSEVAAAGSKAGFRAGTEQPGSGVPGRSVPGLSGSCPWSRTCGSGRHGGAPHPLISLSSYCHPLHVTKSHGHYQCSAEGALFFFALFVCTSASEYTFNTGVSSFQLLTHIPDTAIFFFWLIYGIRYC